MPAWMSRGFTQIMNLLAKQEEERAERVKKKFERK